MPAGVVRGRRMGGRVQIRGRLTAISLGAVMAVSACDCGQGPFNKVQPTLQMPDDSLDFGEVAACVVEHVPGVDAGVRRVGHRRQRGHPQPPWLGTV